MNKSNLVKLSTTHFYEGRMKRHLCTEEMNEIAKLEELKEMHYITMIHPNMKVQQREKYV